MLKSKHNKALFDDEMDTLKLAEFVCWALGGVIMGSVVTTWLVLISSSSNDEEDGARA